MSNNNVIPFATPWGAPEEIKQIAPGIIWYETPSHGGFWLSPERNAQVPLRDRQESFCQNGMLGWYEEDCDAEIVRRTFPEILGRWGEGP